MISLKTVLRANAASCVIFGLLFLWVPMEVTTFLGGETPAPEMVLITLGTLLFVNGLHLLWVSSKSSPGNYLILYFSIGDFIWVVASIILLIQNLWVSTQLGITATILVAIIVAAFGAMQIVQLKEMRSFS